MGGALAAVMEPGRLTRMAGLCGVEPAGDVRAGRAAGRAPLSSEQCTWTALPEVMELGRPPLTVALGEDSARRTI